MIFIMVVVVIFIVVIVMIFIMIVVVVITMAMVAVTTLWKPVLIFLAIYRNTNKTTVKVKRGT